METLPVVINQEIAIAHYNKSSLNDLLKAIETDALNLVADAETKQGRKQIISKAASVAKKKIIIDDARKKLNEERKRLTDKVNEEGKKARDFLDNLKTKVRKPVTDWEEEEEKRIEIERLKVEFELDEESAYSENNLIDREIEMQRKEAEIAAIEAEKLAKEMKERKEKERIEREARIAKEAKEKAEKDALQAIANANQAKIVAERNAKLAVEKAEREKKEALELAEKQKQDAIEKAKKEAEDKIAAEKLAETEKARIKLQTEERKARNLNHQRKVNRETFKCFKELTDLDEATIKKIIALIAHDHISHVTINY